MRTPKTGVAAGGLERWTFKEERREGVEGPGISRARDVQKVPTIRIPNIRIAGHNRIFGCRIQYSAILFEYPINRIIFGKEEKRRLARIFHSPIGAQYVKDLKNRGS